MNFKQHVDCYTKLLNDRNIAHFLKKDVCGALCDKYHVVIIFQFFMRADFKEDDYTPENFFLAIALSHDLYEESKVFEDIIMEYYYLRKPTGTEKSKSQFHWDKLLLFSKMQFKGFVDKKVCSSLLKLIPHKALSKNRKELHTGRVNNKILCEKCKCPMNSVYAQKKATKSDELTDEETESDIENDPKKMRDDTEEIETETSSSS